MADADNDPVVKQYRSQITDADLAVVRAVNARISLSSRLQAYKRDKGYDVVDPAREDWMLSYLTRANPGPMSNEGLEAFYHQLLELSKAEARRLMEREAAAG